MATQTEYQQPDNQKKWSGFSLAEKVVIIFSLIVLTVLVGAALTVPLSTGSQLVLGLLTGCMAFMFRNTTNRKFILFLVGLSLFSSTRYMYWRLTETIEVELMDWVDIAFGVGLILAELYAYLVLLLGFFQTSWPLNRRPVPLPEDVNLWPTIDIFIPSYDEPWKVVKPTVIGALNVDYPKDKINVYVLDDKRREEFARECAAVGVTHITRDNNEHAKAGNVNAALKKTKGEFIAIFDCDHIPTRSFFQTNVGWLLKDPNLAMLQTPHHFFSPDPFERNLHTFKKVPNEGELFYSLVQDGNDFWNATFFCGSCAIIRREPLESVGGIAVETVTEDAHTALKMQRKGWNTAYIPITQAAGLATESLSAHVGQRIRWARGMAQIFRTDNPLLGKGLKFYQRLCYVNAMVHFFYGLPRIVFLTAPVSYLFFEAHIIQAHWADIAVYALPHLFHANLTNSVMQGRFRHSFWSEVYESCLAPYIIMPTTLALINPKLGTFNVTAKGGIVEKEYFDKDIAKPYIWMGILNFVGLMIGVVRYFWLNTHEQGTVVLNMVWTVYNLMIIGATLHVAFETRQVREFVRVDCDLKAMLKLPSGHTTAGLVYSLSEGGFAFRSRADDAGKVPDEFRLVIFYDNKAYSFPAIKVSSEGNDVRARFLPMTPREEIDLVRVLYGRASNWVDWNEGRAIDKPLVALATIFKFSLSGLRKGASAALT